MLSESRFRRVTLLRLSSNSYKLLQDLVSSLTPEIRSFFDIVGFYRISCYVGGVSWKYLIAMLNEQEQLRFMRLWTAAHPAVSGFVRVMVRDRSVADEVLQETSLVLFRRFDEYDEQRPFVAWALGIAKSQVLSLNRDAARSRVSFDTDLLARFTETWAELAPRVSDRSLYLQDCIQRLAARARQMVRLRYYDQLTADQIASQLGGNGVAVRVALQRTRQQLRECVERQLREEGETP